MKFLVFSLVIFIFPIFAHSQVLINEIAWMGNESSANKEWIELWNNSEENVNLNGWRLYSKDNTPDIALSGIMTSQGFFILERSDDLSLPYIKADLIYKGALGNSGEYLILQDNNGNIVDKIDASASWPSGDNITKQTMQLTFGNLVPESGILIKNWITSVATPKEQNKELEIINKKEKQEISNSQILNDKIEQSEIQQSGTKLPNVEKENVVQDSEVINKKTEYQYVNVDYKILISEFMPNPDGNDTETEWIEIFNASDKEAQIGGFILDDKQGGSTEYIIPFGTNILPQAVLVFKRQDTKIALNNADDMVRLLYPSGEVLAQVVYDKAEENQSASLNLNDNKFYWTENITPGEINIIVSSQKSIIKDGEIKQNIFEVQPQKINSNLKASAGELNLKTSISKEIIIWSIIIGIMIGIFGVLGYQKWILFD